MTHQYALLKGSEDGSPFTMLTPAELADMLADPANWGVAEFVNATDMAELGPDLNLWPDKVAVLLRVEVVVPERARGYMLLPADPQRVDWRHARADGSPITLGEVLD